MSPSVAKRLSPDHLAAIAAADPTETVADLARRLGTPVEATRRARKLAAAGETRPLKRHACPDCGNPVRRATDRCPACRDACTKRHDRARNAVRRPRPAPIFQGPADLPPIGELLGDDDGERIQCHVCGRLYGNLGAHARAHGLTHAEYRSRYGLDRTQPLVSPAVAAKRSALALARNLGDLGRANLVEHGSHRPPGIPASLQTRLAKSAAADRRREEPTP